MWSSFTSLTSSITSVFGSSREQEWRDMQNEWLIADESPTDALESDFAQETQEEIHDVVEIAKGKHIKITKAREVPAKTVSAASRHFQVEQPLPASPTLQQKPLTNAEKINPPHQALYSQPIPIAPAQVQISAMPEMYSIPNAMSLSPATPSTSLPSSETQPLTIVRFSPTGEAISVDAVQHLYHNDRTSTSMPQAQLQPRFNEPIYNNTPTPQSPTNTAAACKRKLKRSGAQKHFQNHLTIASQDIGTLQLEKMLLENAQQPLKSASAPELPALTKVTASSSLSQQLAAAGQQLSVNNIFFRKDAQN